MYIVYIIMKCCTILLCSALVCRMRIILGYDPADVVSSNALAFFHPGDLSDQHQMEAHMQGGMRTQTHVHTYVHRMCLHTYTVMHILEALVCTCMHA